MIFTSEPFDISVRLRSVISLIRNLTDKKDIHLVVQIPENAEITGDYNILSTVVRNLLNNAVKFTAQGGTVTLAVEPVHEGKHIIAVSDTGVGMTKEQVRNLFSLDSAHSQPGTAGEQGTGLGLIVCKDLLEKHGTTLHVESEEGKGSRFWFEILF
jgi:signal transduction histidine kinase